MTPSARARLGLGLGLAAALLSNACLAHYEDALGYRARQAAIRGDADQFVALMEEAADTLPQHPYDNPKKTVLTHFLDLGGDKRFFPIVDDWMKRGWVSEHMTCAIHRARYRGMRDVDPIEAHRAADICVDRARAAAYDGERSWEIGTCLEAAPFLTETSTVTLTPYLSIAADPTEPRKFRQTLLDGMTALFMQDAFTRRANDPSLLEAGAKAGAERQVLEVSTRLRAILDALSRVVDTALLGSGSAFGVAELERASLTTGRSFIGLYADSGVAELEDLAWTWVRSMKTRERNMRIASLGFWNRKREPKGDAYWYLCSRTAVDETFSVANVEAVAVRAASRADPEAVRAQCTGYPSVAGPYPLFLTARGTLTASVARTSSVSRVRVSVAARRTLR